MWKRVNWLDIIMIIIINIIKIDTSLLECYFSVVFVYYFQCKDLIHFTMHISLPSYHREVMTNHDSAT